MKKQPRNAKGQFISSRIKPGCLYSFNGVVVRAKSLCSNGLRHITCHKVLNGFCHDNELEPVDTQKVNKYLACR
jgi:hypothetical protein